MTMEADKRIEFLEHHVEVLQDQNLRLIQQSINPPVILTERGEEIRKMCNEDMRKEYIHIVGRLYWK